jgi:polyribonucleotide nucleotidyltransferase
MPIDGRIEETVDFFALHYDFPPYATGECGMATQVRV